MAITRLDSCTTIQTAAYTMNRLEQALRLFRRSKTTLDAEGFHHKYLGDYILSKYDLRAREPCQDRTLGVAWDDTDDQDSDYKPRRPLRKKRSAPSTICRNPSKRPKIDDSLLVAFRLSSVAAKAFLSSLVSPATGQNLQQTKVPFPNPFLDYDDDHPSWSIGQEPSEPRETQSLLSLDLDHPAARGCKSCWEFAQQCSLIEEPFDFPCKACRTGHLDCDLVTPGRLQSSLPQVDPINPLPAQSADGSQLNNHPKPSSSFLTKSQARLEHMLSQPWNLNDLIQKSTESPRLPPSKIQLPSGPSTAHDRHHEIETGKTCIITTSFAHPIDFAYEPPDDGSRPCHWCSDFTYGMFGLGEVKVEVIQYEGHDSLVEIDGGHVGQGCEPSRMCTICALERVHITNCIGHTIASLRGYDPLTFDYEAAFDSLAPPLLDNPNSGNNDRKLQQINPWCLLCPNPAFFGCATLQSVDKFFDPIPPSSPSAVGCGLVLCTTCAQLMKTFNCDISKVLATTKAKEGKDGARADAIYLLPGSELYHSYCG